MRVTSGTVKPGWRLITEEEQGLVREAVRRVLQAIEDHRLPTLSLPRTLEPKSSLTEELVHHITHRLELQEGPDTSHPRIGIVIEGMNLTIDKSMRYVRGKENLTFTQVAVLLFLSLKGWEFVLPELRLNVYLRMGKIFSLPQ